MTGRGRVQPERCGLGLVAAVLAALVLAPGRAGAAEEHVVAVRQVQDLKSVFATVESVDVVAARARNGGTVAGLAVDEGSRVAAGAVLAVVTDEKLALGLRTLDARLAEARARFEQARTELARAEQLRATGVAAQARLDDARTSLAVAENQVKAVEAERTVLLRQVAEGEVLAPAAGRVLQVPVTNGSVVLPGEPIARIAAETFVLRAEVPERHARFLEVGSAVVIGARGGDPAAEPIGRGTIRQVYPELARGRVVVDIAGEALDRFLVGERVRVLVAAGERNAIVVPAGFVETRHGLDLVRVKDAAGSHEVVVQRARVPGADGGVEILSGLKPGDVLVRP